jgi:hypothetical protein
VRASLSETAREPVRISGLIFIIIPENRVVITYNLACNGWTSVAFEGFIDPRDKEDDALR